MTLQRRRIFVNFGRIAEMSIDGAHMSGGTVDLDRFTRRTGEILASELYNKPVEQGTVVDVAITPSTTGRGWKVSDLAITRGRGLRLRSTQVVPWDEHPELFQVGALAEQLADLREMNPTDLANAVEGMSHTRRNQLAAALDDEELADLLEEMPEQDQIRLLASVGLERSADVVEEMEPDDAADLLAEMPDDQRERLLTAMESVQAADIRRLLRYDARTAGGLMTSEPVIVAPDVPVAEVLARIREPERPITAAAQVYVCEPPNDPDRAFPRQCRIPATAAASSRRDRRRVRRGKHLRPSRTARARAGGPSGRVQPGQRGRLRWSRSAAGRGHRR